MQTKNDSKTVAITGNTYPVKEQLKELGARWNGDLKAWMVTEDKAAQAQQIVAGAGPKKVFSGARTFGARGSFGYRQAWAHLHNGGVGYCGNPGCGRTGCSDCRD